MMALKRCMSHMLWLTVIVVLSSPTTTSGIDHSVEIDEFEDLWFDDEFGNSSNITTTSPSDSNTTTTTERTNTTSTESTTTSPEMNSTTTQAPFLPEEGKKVGIATAVLAAPALVFAATASLYIKSTLFLSGGGALGYAFYMFSPMIFKTTSFCCGSHGTPLGHVTISVIVGAIGGLLTLWILKLGLFLVGMTVGIVVGLICLYIPPLENNPFFDHAYGFAVYYTIFALGFGMFSMFFRKCALVATTALVGTFIFMLGIDFFAKTNFTAIMHTALLDMETKIKDQFEGNVNARPFRKMLHGGSHREVAMIASWIVLAIIAMVVQTYLLRRSKAKKDKNVEELRQTAYEDDRHRERDRIRERWATPPRSRVGRNYRRGGYGESNDMELSERPLIPSRGRKSVN